MPLYVFCDDHLLVAQPRTSNRDGASRSLEELQKIVASIRRGWKRTRIIVRVDSGFCRDPLLDWCEQNGVGYVLGIPRNARLEAEIEDHLFDADLLVKTLKGRDKATLSHTFRWKTLWTWSRERRVIGKAEGTKNGRTPRFVVTSLGCENSEDAEQVYRDVYCQRGEIENRVKKQQLHLFADRTSAHTMQANQVRLYFSSVAYFLVDGLRHVGLKGTEFGRAQCATIRNKLLRIGIRVRVTCRKISIHLSSACPNTARRGHEKTPLRVGAGFFRRRGDRLKIN